MRYLTSEKKIIRSTKLKWALVFSATIIALVSTFAFLIFGLMVRITTERFDDSVIERAERIERRLRLIPIPLRDELLLNISDALALITPDQEFVQFITSDGLLLGTTGVQAPAPESLREGFEDVKFSVTETDSEQVFRTYTKAVTGPGGRSLLYVRSGVDVTDLRQQQHLFLIAMVLTVVLSGAGAWVIGFLLSSYILRPLSSNYQRLKRFSLLSSHELKTPLTIMKSATDLLADDENLTEPSRNKVEILKGTIKRIETLTSQLLLLSKSEESDFTKKHVSPFSLRTMLSGLKKDFEETAVRKGIIMVLHCPEDIEVNTSEELLTIILTNLIDNALRFTEPGGRVEVSALSIGGKTRIAIRDTGIGINKMDQRRVFERFFKAGTTKEDKSGTGLGLSIVGELAQVIGAEISLFSEPCKGSEFVVSL